MDQLLVRAFGYEMCGGATSDLWRHPLLFAQSSGMGGKWLDEKYREWHRGRRAFVREELFRGRWVKVSDHGLSFVMQLHPDGTFTETELIKPFGVSSPESQKLGPMDAPPIPQGAWITE